MPLKINGKIKKVSRLIYAKLTEVGSSKNTAFCILLVCVKERYRKGEIKFDVPVF